MSKYGTFATSTTHVDSHTSLWAKVRRSLLCSGADAFEGNAATEEEQKNLLQKPIRRGGNFLCIEVEWAEEKPKRRRYK